MVHRYGLLITLLSFGSIGFASTVVQSFSWRADSKFEINLAHDNAAKAIKGELRDGASVEVKSAGLTVTLQSYVEGFVTVVVSADGEDVSYVSILERQNASYIVLNKQPILAKKSSVLQELADSLKSLKALNKWDASQSIRAMVSYFSSNPAQKFSKFYDEVELGNIKLIAKPQPRTVSGPPVDRPPDPVGDTRRGTNDPPPGNNRERELEPNANSTWVSPRPQPPAGDPRAQPDSYAERPREADDYNQMQLNRLHSPQPQYWHYQRPRETRQGDKYFKIFPE